MHIALDRTTNQFIDVVCVSKRNTTTDTRFDVVTLSERTDKSKLRFCIYIYICSEANSIMFLYVFPCEIPIKNASNIALSMLRVANLWFQVNIFLGYLP